MQSPYVRIACPVCQVTNMKKLTSQAGLCRGQSLNLESHNFNEMAQKLSQHAASLDDLYRRLLALRTSPNAAEADISAVLAEAQEKFAWYDGLSKVVALMERDVLGAKKQKT
jgi:hypothetical protein